jgi:hypothetical protein
LGQRRAREAIRRGKVFHFLGEIDGVTYGDDLMIVRLETDNRATEPLLGFADALGGAVPIQKVRHAAPNKRRFGPGAYPKAAMASFVLKSAAAGPRLQHVVEQADHPRHWIA